LRLWTGSHIYSISLIADCRSGLSSPGPAFASLSCDGHRDLYLRIRRGQAVPICTGIIVYKDKENQDLALFATTKEQLSQIIATAIVAIWTLDTANTRRQMLKCSNVSCACFSLG